MVSTNSIANVGKLAIAFVLVLMGAKIYHHLNYLNLGLLFFVIWLTVILWFFRISFYSSAIVDVHDIEIKISINIFGHTTVFLKVDSDTFKKKIWLKNKHCNFSDVTNIKLELVSSTPAQVKLTLDNFNSSK
tara:strand:+ start:322 stop:717 length:396 start_codon:yes stop_codon:yes gene_type:complete